MQPTFDKHRILDALRQRMDARLDALLASQQSAQAGAIHEENRQEHPKDTRAIEAQYLARGLAERAESLRDATITLAALKVARFAPDARVAVTALVALEFESSESVYFLVPVGGGEQLQVDGETIQTLTPNSPLGRAVAGHRTDDTVEIELPAGRRDAVIAWVA
ncbi:MAG: transcription elongation GreA/GreB family factor [Hyphomicrobiaceae bacterium]|jgi:transcription elongation GreA/GreB family factor